MTTALPGATKASPQLPASSTQQFDVAIIGAGIAGASAASALSRAGLNVALIDFRDRHPADFRAEKIGERQIEFFDSFGLGAAARDQLTAFDGVWVRRFGRIVEKSHKREYSSPYGDLVNALRDALPAAIKQFVARVVEVRTNDEHQEVELADGRVISSRLLVVATGLGEAIRNKLGVGRVMRSRAHSVVGGFDLANPVSDFPFPSLVWMTERPSDKTAYLSLFPMGDRIRANLFLYRAPDDPWCMQFRKDPAASLRELLPAFERTFQPMVIQGPVQFRPNDIATASNHRQAGFVLIGDAFFTTCPVTGTGMDKALNDVDRLRQLVPQWLATPGMSAEKTGQLYDDPVKQQVDSASLDLSLRERAARMDDSLSGSILRFRRNVLRRSAYRAMNVIEGVTPLQFSHH